MTRDLTVEQLAATLGISPRTLRRWIRDEGCPADEHPQRVNAAEVRTWCATQGKRLPSAPAPVAPDPGPPPPTGPSRATLATAELARRLTAARMNELELAAEKGLKDLGLGERIRAAKTHADLLEYTKQLIELVGSGALMPDRGNSLRQLIAQASREMKAGHAQGEGAHERILLTTEEGWTLLEAFEGIVSDARRAELVELVLAAAKKDAEENPNVDLAAGLPLDEPEVPPADELEAEQP